MAKSFSAKNYVQKYGEAPDLVCSPLSVSVAESFEIEMSGPLFRCWSLCRIQFFCLIWISLTC